MQRSLTKGLLAGAIASLFISSPAYALDFFFSFSDDGSGVPGTVSGRILGLNDNQAGQMASSILIDSFPAGLGGSFDISNDPTEWTVTDNSFTVTNGDITAANFEAVSLPVDDLFCINANAPAATALCSTNELSLTLDNGTTEVRTFGGAAAITFTPVPFEFEASLGLVTLGIMAGGYALRKKAKAAKLITRT